MEKEETRKPRPPKVEEISVERAIRLLQAGGADRLVQIRRDALDPDKIISIIVHE